MLHESRPSGPWLIFDVGQNMAAIFHSMSSVLRLVVVFCFSSTWLYGQSTGRPIRWGDVIDAVMIAFDRDSAAVTGRLDARDFRAVYAHGHPDFISKVDEQRFLDSLKKDLTPLSKNHILVGKELIFTGDLKAPPATSDGKFFMTAVVSYKLSEKTFYASTLWEFDERSKRWRFRNFPYGYSCLPYHLRIAGMQVP